MKNLQNKYLKVAAIAVIILGAADQYSFAQNSNPWPTLGPVGIGTTTPAHDLEIDHSSNWTNLGSWQCGGCTSALTINATTSDQSIGPNQTQTGPQVPAFDLFEIFYTDAPPYLVTAPTPRACMTVNNYGQTAINKATAAHTLDVGGDLNADNNLTIGGTGSIASDLSTGGNLGVTGILQMNEPNWHAAIQGQSSSEGIVLWGSNNGWIDGSGMMVNTNSTNNTWGQGSIVFVANDPTLTTTTNGPNDVAFNFVSADYSGSNTIWNSIVNIYKNGVVAIGSGIIANNTIPAGYNLYVQNGILTEKLKVASSGDPTNWSDFVFAKNYKLMPLTKVESFVKENKHLPEIPSAKEVAKEGIDVAQMDAKLLQKIEELTLYAIQQQKEIEQQKKEIELLKKKVN